MDYYHKYLKYKNKYLLLKNQYGSGNITDLDGKKIIFNLYIDRNTILQILSELGIQIIKIFKIDKKFVIELETDQLALDNKELIDTKLLPLFNKQYLWFTNDTKIELIKERIKWNMLFTIYCIIFNKNIDNFRDVFDKTEENNNKILFLKSLNEEIDRLLEIRKADGNEMIIYNFTDITNYLYFNGSKHFKSGDDYWHLTVNLIKKTRLDSKSTEVDSSEAPLEDEVAPARAGRRRGRDDTEEKQHFTKVNFDEFLLYFILDMHMSFFSKLFYLTFLHMILSYETDKNDIISTNAREFHRYYTDILVASPPAQFSSPPSPSEHQASENPNQSKLNIVKQFISYMIFNKDIIEKLNTLLEAKKPYISSFNLIIENSDWKEKLLTPKHKVGRIIRTFRNILKSQSQFLRDPFVFKGNPKIVDANKQLIIASVKPSLSKIFEINPEIIRQYEQLIDTLPKEEPYNNYISEYLKNQIQIIILENTKYSEIIKTL